MHHGTPTLDCITKYKIDAHAYIDVYLIYYYLLSISAFSVNILCSMATLENYFYKNHLKNNILDVNNNKYANCQLNLIKTK